MYLEATLSDIAVYPTLAFLLPLSDFCRTFAGATLIPTVADFDESVELRAKSIMEMLEAVKTILEIIVIFITFPQYAPLLAAIAALGAVYYCLLQEGDNNNEAKELGTSIPEVTEESPDFKQLRPSQSTPEPDQ